MSELHTTEDRQRVINRAGMITISCNVILTAARAIAAVHSGSTAVLADAANSGTDIFATLVVMGGSRIAALPPDINHPYGHYKAEPVAAKLVGILVTITGVLAAMAAWHALQAERTEPIGLIAAWVTGASILVKEFLARFLIRTAKRTGNQALEADGANQRTDVLASIAALVGAIGGRIGLPALDPAMAILVAGLILRMGLGLYWRSVNNLMDPAPDPLVMSRIRFAIGGVSGVQQVDEVKARKVGAGIYVDCKIAVDCMLTVEAGHRIARRVKRAIRAAVPETLDVLVHVNPGRPVHAGPARRLVRTPRNVL